MNFESEIRDLDYQATEDIFLEEDIIEYDDSATEYYNQLISESIL
jgi:hypothetical protein